MIARQQTTGDKADLWRALAAKLPEGVISWRQDGRPVERDGRYIARFVSYIEANTVRERLDSVVPGEWDLMLEPLKELMDESGKTIDEDKRVTFKARLQILGVIREDVGCGKDYKQASTDAFKRVAVRFGIGAELYDMEMNWVQMDGDGKYAKPLEDPAVAYARRHGGARPALMQGTAGTAGTAADAARAGDERPAPAAPAADEPSCPKCGGRMWDNRLTKRNPKAPDYKCRDRACDGVIWPPKEEKGAMAATGAQTDALDERQGGDEPPPHDDDDLPF
jgi:hypothetical protein